MLYIPADGNALADGIAELHLQETEDITVILPDGDEIYISGTGHIETGDGRKIDM